jgi:hypothetical protein
LNPLRLPRDRSELLKAVFRAHHIGDFKQKAGSFHGVPATSRFLNAPITLCESSKPVSPKSIIPRGADST